MLNKSEPQTLEEQKTELEFSMKESDYQTALRKEMEKIRKEGKITDRYEIIREAEIPPYTHYKPPPPTAAMMASTKSSISVKPLSVSSSILYNGSRHRVTERPFHNLY